MTPANTGPSKSIDAAPGDERRSREGDLGEQEVSRLLPPWQGSETGGHPDPQRISGVGPGGEPPGFDQHGAHAEVVRAGARLGSVAVDEQELLHPVGGGSEQVPLETEDVPVPSVDAGDGPASHELDFVGDGDARHRGPTDVVVGDQECPGDPTQDSDLVTHPHQIGSGRRFDLTDDLELAHPRHDRGPDDGRPLTGVSALSRADRRAPAPQRRPAPSGSAFLGGATRGLTRSFGLRQGGRGGPRMLRAGPASMLILEKGSPVTSTRPRQPHVRLDGLADVESGQRHEGRLSFEGPKQSAPRLNLVADQRSGGADGAGSRPVPGRPGRGVPR